MASIALNSYPHYPDAVALTWKFSDSKLPGNYNVWIERSGSPAGPFERVHTIPLLNASSFVHQDQDMEILSKEKYVYYRVYVTLSDGTSLYSDVVTLFSPLDKKDWLEVKKLNKKEALRLKKVGVPVLVIKKKQWGDQCSCIDRATGLLTKDFCLDCYSTGIKGGYYDPIPTCAEIVIQTQHRDLDSQGMGVKETYNAQLRMMSYPPVVREDMIVEENSNIRWNVWEQQNIEWRRMPTAQTSRIERVPGGNIKMYLEWERNEDHTYTLKKPDQVLSADQAWRKRT